MRNNLFIILLLATSTVFFFTHASSLRAAVLYSSNAESGTCNTAVPPSIWDDNVSSQKPNSRMFYYCDTPLPNSLGGTKYFQVNTVNDQTDSGNTHGVTRINLTPGHTYYLGAFFRFDRVGGIDIWHDGNGLPDSYDKLFEFWTTTRAIITAGFPDWAECSNNACDHKFTFGSYLAFETCTGCIYEQVEPNVSPYGRTNFLLLDYERWHAVVLGWTPSTGSTQNGRLELWINGIKTTDRQNIKTQNSSSPYIETFIYSGTTAQPAYDAPAHLRKVDQFTFADSLADMVSLGLMSDPESGSTPSPTPLPDTQAPSAPGSLTASVISSTQVNLTWSAATDNVGVTGYRVERCQGGGCTNFAQISTLSGTSFSNTTLTAGTTYQYRVRAVDGAGNLSPYSSIASATTSSETTSDSIEAFCPEGPSPDPRVIFCENWDVGTPPTGFPQIHNTTWRGWVIDDAGAPNEGLSELSTVVRRSGSRSLHKVKRANEHSVPNQIYNVGNIPEFRMRFYVYFDSTYANVNKAVDEDYVHFIFLQSALSGRGVRMDILPAVNKTGALIPELRFAWPPTCIKDPDRGAYLGIASPSGIGSTFKGVTQGSSDLCFDIHQNLQRWIPIEWAYKIVNTNEGRASLWIDGIQRMRDELMPPDPDYMMIHRMILSGYMSTFRNYDAGFYLDDIVVANDYTMDLGGTGILNAPPSDTTPPAVPGNVRVL